MIDTRKLQKKLYINLLNLIYNSYAIHAGSCLSCLDILIQTLVFEISPQDEFILSKGHGAAALYVVFNYLGKISNKELRSFYKDGTRLPALTPKCYPGTTSFATGSLGHGLSLSCGIAQAMTHLLKNKKKTPKAYCLMSDGECNEGQVWEAAQYASQKQLANLIVLIDKNRLQAIGKIKDVLGDSASIEKWRAFGFDVFEGDGHNLHEMRQIFKKIRRRKNKKPKLIIFNTVKGHGVSFMENKLEWHYRHLTKDLYQKAIKEINKKYDY